MTGPVIAGIAALAVAIVGAAFSYMNAQRLHRRQERLARINRQLSELYGPLLALLEANRRSYEEFLRVYRSGSRNFFNPELPPPTPEEEALWRLWVSVVFRPTNRKIYDLIVEKADLLVGDEMPECLLDFCAHKSGYDVITAQWDNGDFSSQVSLISHPRKVINQYAKDCFSSLKKAQSKLLLQINQP